MDCFQLLVSWSTFICSIDLLTTQGRWNIFTGLNINMCPHLNCSGYKMYEKEKRVILSKKRFNGIVEWIKWFNFWLTDYICSYFIVVMAYLLEFEALAFYILIWMNTRTVISFASMNIELFDLFKHLIGWDESILFLGVIEKWSLF